MENKIDYAKYIALHLIEYCEVWKYNYIERLAEHKTPEQFYKIFCKLTKTYFAPIGDDHYNVTFSKEGTATVKRCGPDFDKRSEDAIISIHDILEHLPNKETSIKTEEEIQES